MDHLPIFASSALTFHFSEILITIINKSNHALNRKLGQLIINELLPDQTLQKMFFEYLRYSLLNSIFFHKEGVKILYFYKFPQTFKLLKDNDNQQKIL